MICSWPLYYGLHIHVHSHTSSAFANDYLHKLTPKQLDLYDTLINTPSNDWQLYYWIVGREDTPQEYDNEVMDLLKEHARNPDRKKSNIQPSL